MPKSHPPFATILEYESSASRTAEADNDGWNNSKRRRVGSHYLNHLTEVLRNGGVADSLIDLYLRRARSIEGHVGTIPCPFCFVGRRLTAVVAASDTPQPTKQGPLST